MDKLGFIGMGNMAKALCKGFLSSGKIKKENVYAYAPTYEKLVKNSEECGFNSCSDLKMMVMECDTLIMACKPYQIEDVLSDIKDELKGKALISVAAGWNFDKYMNYLDNSVRLQFVMPNTPAMVREGVFLFEDKTSLTDDELSKVKDLFCKIGKVITLKTDLMGIGSAVSGCGPAFVDMFIEAYADAAVKYGMQRKTAYELISQTLLGAAKLQLETGEHPGVLKDNVCSPGGTTIRGVAALENTGFRNACIKSIDAIMNRE